VSTVAESLKGRSFTKLADWRHSELGAVLDLSVSDELKRARRECDEPYRAENRLHTQRALLTFDRALVGR
jgi:ornithine carbamoyltransferase